jgi:hypothetical protein
MKLLEKIFKKLMLNESVDLKDVEEAIDNHTRIIINYHSKGEDNNTGARVIEVYAYGLTKAGNPCIRAFQPYGDTTSRVPSWKFFRLDRISEWQPTKQIFTKPADFYYKNEGDFNPNGDETMSVVYKVAKFDNNSNFLTIDNSKTNPKTKNDVYKTDSENRMERLKQQTDNPIKLSDIKIGDAFKQLGQETQNISKEPKTQYDVHKTDADVKKQELAQQTQNPNVNSTQTEYKSQEKTPEEKQKELEKLRQTLSDKSISLSDLYKKMKEEPQQTRWEDIFDDKAQKDLEQMRKRDMINQRRRDNRWQKSVDTRPLHRKGSLNREDF